MSLQKALDRFSIESRLADIAENEIPDAKTRLAHVIGREYAVPTVHFIEPMFFAQYPDRIERTDTVDARSPFRFAFTETQTRLTSAPEISAGVRTVELGPPHMDTIGLHVLRFERGASLTRARTTANSIFAVIEGEGRSTIDGERFEWSRGDVLVVPAWRPALHEASANSFLLRVTDEPLLQKLHWLREEQ